MLSINPEIVCAFINKAREFQAKEGVVIPEDRGELSEEDFLQILADHSNDLTYQETSTAINDLEPDQQMSLVALMYIGRGDYEKSEWDTAFQVAKNRWNNQTAQYLLSTPLVADFLQEALSQFGYSCEERA